MKECNCPENKRSSKCPIHGSCYCCHGGTDSECPRHALSETLIDLAQYELEEFNSKHICAAIKEPGNICIFNQNHQSDHYYDGPNFYLERCGAVYTKDSRITCLLPGQHLRNLPYHWCAGIEWGRDLTIPNRAPVKIVCENGLTITVGGPAPEGHYYRTSETEE